MSRADRRPGAVDRSGLSRRAMILADAIELFDRLGYQGTTIDAIGEASGVTGPAIYRHFKSKSDLLTGIFSDTMGQILERWQEVAAEGRDPHETIGVLLRFHISYVLDHPALMRIVRSEARELPAEARTTFRRMQAEYLEVLAGQLRAWRDWDDEGEAEVVAFGVLSLLNAFAQRRNVLDRPALERLLEDMAWAVLAAPVEGAGPGSGD